MFMYIAMLHLDGTIQVVIPKVKSHNVCGTQC